jgi:8-oxo-dGTP pyrophosphatase MutT (NUDIX family)
MESIARARLAAGALFVRDDSVLLVHKTYGSGWDLPGGWADPGEAPAAACRREVAEELGLDRVPQRLLVCDWAPQDSDDKILFVFDCGDLGDENAIVLQDAEVERWEWISIDAVHDQVVPQLARRVWRAFEAYHSGVTVYLEYGELVAVS